MDYGKCAEISTNKIITAKENSMRFNINNPSGKLVTKIKVDGCVITDDSKRCDYMFEITDIARSKNICRVIYLELKGRHIQEAYVQLVTTIDRFIIEHRSCKKECHIVSSKVPMTAADVQQLKIKMLKNKQAALIVSTTQAFVTV
jgi:hypothetical protein